MQATLASAPDPHRSAKKGNVMKRFVVCLLVLSFTLPLFASEEHKLDELTGVLKKNAKALSSCLL